MVAHPLFHRTIRNIGPVDCRNAVKTGKYRQGDEKRKGTQSPDELCDSFADFVDRLLGQALHPCPSNGAED